MQYRILSNPFSFISVLSIALGLMIGNISALGGGDIGGQKSGEPPSSISPTSMSLEVAKERLNRVERNAAYIQSKFLVGSIPSAEPAQNNLKNFIAQAHDALNSGNYALVFSLCTQADNQIAILNNLLHVNSGKEIHSGSEQGGMQMDQFRKNKAQWDFQKTNEKFENFAQRLQENKSPTSAALVEKIKNLLAQASVEISNNNSSAVKPILEQVESLFPSLSQLVEQGHNDGKPGFNGGFQDSHKNQQPITRLSSVQATEIYNRLREKLARIRDHNKEQNDPKSIEQLIRINDMADKCREFISSGQGDAAKEMGLKAEGLLAEWHQGAEKASGSILAQTKPLLERMKAKMEKASQIVKSSGNEKAARILDKGLEHFEKAEQGQMEGQQGRTQAELDIALKLAAKAVDIARSSVEH